MPFLYTNKAARRDQISVKFLKGAADVLACPLSKIMNWLVKLSVFLEECKITKLKSLRNTQKLIPKTKRDDLSNSEKCLILWYLFHIESSFCL